MTSLNTPLSAFKILSLPALCAALLLTGCETPYGIIPGETRTRVHSAREIRDTAGTYSDTSLYQPHTFGFRIESGEKDLFEYYHKSQDEVSIADDEFSESLYFVLPAGTEDLIIDSSSFAAHKVRYIPHCYCQPTFGVVDSGRIVVHKTGADTYSVEARVGFEYRYEEGVPAGTGYNPGRGQLRFLKTFKRK